MALLWRIVLLKQIFASIMNINASFLLTEIIVRALRMPLASCSRVKEQKPGNSFLPVNNIRRHFFLKFIYQRVSNTYF